MPNQSTILIVDDEALIRRMLGEALSGAGYQVRQATDAAEARAALSSSTIDLLLLDLQLGDSDGIDLLREVRRDYAQLPVIIITAHGSLPSAIEALRHDAADYILKPVSVEELRRRVGEALAQHRARQQRNTLIRSMYHQLQSIIEESGPLPAAAPPAPANAISRVGPLTLDVPRHLVHMRGQPVEVTPTEFIILQELARQPDAVVTCATLVHAIQHIDIDEEEARQIIRPHILRLRRKIEPDPQHPIYIESVRSLGYRWNSAS
jgi:DNA-binding response OmpR family regulator